MFHKFSILHPNNVFLFSIMKLIKQSKLFFKEGNSDKIYEIDLCEISPDQYIVNFRFGRRGSVLKEGTKTDRPISLSSAESVFETLESEKRRKGYQTAQEISSFLPITSAPAFTPTLPEIEGVTGIEKAILTRLKGLVENRQIYKTRWKPSRIIWRAGELRLKTAVPFILRLIDQGDEMQRYASLWALARCGDKSAVNTLKLYFNHQKYTAKTRRVAGEGLVQLLEGEELQNHLAYYLQRLPEELRNALSNPNVFSTVLHEKLLHPSLADYEFLEDLYTLSIDNKPLKKEIISILQKIELKPNHFKPVRHILKIAELRDDFEVLGLLAYRFERSIPFYNSPRLSHQGYQEIYRIKAELQKKNSNLAYSDKTKAYLIRKTLRQLKESGSEGHINYVKFALSILLSYDAKNDFKAAYSTTEYHYSNNYRNWEQIRKHYPNYYDAILLNLILYGGSNRLKFTGKVWMNAKSEVISSNLNNSTTAPLNPAAANPGSILNRVFDSIFGLFAPKSLSNDHSGETPASDTSIVREELFPELWDHLPQAYIQLLLQAKADPIHQFAIQNLSQHADYGSIRKRIDFKMIQQLLASEYVIPARFGLGLARQYLEANPDRILTLTLLGSPLYEARQLGIELIERDLNGYFEESAFIIDILFSNYSDVRIWAKASIAKLQLNEDKQQLLIGRIVTKLVDIKENTPENNSVIRSTAEILLKSFSTTIIKLNSQILFDLLSTEVEATQVLAVKIIILKNVRPSAELLCTLLASPYASVRKEGRQLLINLDEYLKTEASYGTSLVNYLVPMLMRKEPYEGLHQDISAILSTQLSKHLQEVNLTSTIRLIHSNYTPAQKLGMVLLTNYVNPKELTLRQIVDLGNHESVVFREWCCSFFSQNVSRIKFERDEAIRLLDAKWDDTRAFAIQFFREKFGAEDWSPEVLTGLADSVRPDIEAFGRELISRFFEEEQGEEYLLKLSQHPSTRIQLFATNYLERFANNDINKLQKLNFYFRSVLTRVNKGRSAKSRIFRFLHLEALKSQEAALLISEILRDISATVSIEDKAMCISIMRDLKDKFDDLPLPIKVLDFEERIN